MCRWLAYSGRPVFLSELIFETEHSLIDQSLAATHSPSTTNGDGFGVGWRGDRQVPGVYRDIRPAWNDGNLRDLAYQIRSPLFLAHVRATTGTEVQRSNCHPFRHGRWLFVHNGLIADFPRLRRDLALELPTELFDSLVGTTDSELMFLLAVSLGLEEDPFGALERMVGLVEAVGARHRVEQAMQMTLGLLDGERILAVRYSTEGRSRSLFHSKDPRAVEELNPQMARPGRRAVMIVSEPLTGMSNDWEAIPEATSVLVERGALSCRRFVPQHPA